MAVEVLVAVPAPLSIDALVQSVGQILAAAGFERDLLSSGDRGTLVDASVFQVRLGAGVVDCNGLYLPEEGEGGGLYLVISAARQRNRESTYLLALVCSCVAIQGAGRIEDP